MSKLLNCSICGNSAVRIIFVKNGFNFIRCRNCNLVYVWPQLNVDNLRQIYNDFGKNYYLTEERLSIDFSLDHKERIKFLLKLNHGKGRLLDIGCSTGSFLKLAKDGGWQVYGVDIAQDSCKYARDKLGLDVFCGNLLEAHFNDDYFDVVRMWGTLEHIPNPDKYLKESYRILRRGGIIAISIPNFKSLEVSLLKKKYRYFTETHLWYFSPYAIRKILEKIGFRVEILFTEGFDPILIWDDLRRKPLPSINHCLRERKVHKQIKSKNWYPLLRLGLKTLSWFINSIGKGQAIVVYARKG